MPAPEIIRKIKKIHIKSARLVDSIMAGQYKSVFRGAGIEFEEVREYTADDDVKHIDWKVSARMGRPFVKRYREERELLIMLLLDVSASTRFGTVDSLKMEKAAEIASIIAFNAIKNNDKVGAILFTDRVERYIPPRKGTAHVWRVIREMFTYTPQHTGTRIESALRFLGRVTAKRSVSFLISDFIDEEYRRPLSIAARKHEMIGILLSDPGEFALPEGGIVTVRDLETGEIRTLDAGHRVTRRWFTERARSAYHRRRERLGATGVDVVEIDTTAEAADELVRYFRYRERRKRKRG
jgi:uncharacterized protein (DUF58 family)